MEMVKACKCCGRTIEWRKKWQDCWQEIQFCSEKCRKSRRSKLDEQLESTIIELLSKRSSSSTICPSEAARLCLGEDAWKPEMERTRQAARRLVAQGRIHFTQKGIIVDPSNAKGPIRLRRGPDF
jgi:hypothetical protein